MNETRVAEAGPVPSSSVTKGKTEAESPKLARTESVGLDRPLVGERNDIQVVTDLLGVITDLNPRAEEILGHSRDRIIGTPFANYFTDPGRAEEGIRRVLTEGHLINYELVLRPHEGEATAASYTLDTLEGQDGKARGVVALARDITSQKQTEKELRESQTYNRGLIEASPDALVTVDLGLRITDVNEQMVHLTGLTRRQLIGSVFSSLFADPQRAEEGIRLSLKKGPVTNYEMLLCNRTGERIPVALNTGTLYDMSGNVAGVLATARDITEQKRIETELRESQNYTRDLVESNIDALMATDVLGRITDVNRQMEELTGLARAQIIGTPFRRYFTDQKQAEDAIRRVLREDRVTNYELTMRTRGGGRIEVSCNATTFRDTQGRLKGVFAAARDVTEHRRLHDQLEQRNRELEVQNRRAEEANRLKTEFLASMSHELRTPLNSIIGFSEFLVSQANNGLTPEQREYLGDINESGEHLLRLINDILDLSKVESGKLVLAPAPFSPREALQAVCSVVRPMIDEKHLTLSTHVAVGLDIVVIDELRFKQILFNLLSNAVKFTNAGGRIHITITRTHNDRLVLRVNDTGIGIAPDDVPRLFRQFEQLETGPGRRFQGSGLGLYLTRKLVDMHGGTIDVESEVGKGTTFTVILPARVDQRSPVGSPPSTAP